jgi:3-oxoacyl-[acyl-carrier protein] reductase
MTEAVAGDDATVEIQGRTIKVGVSPAVMDRVRNANPFGRPGTPAEAAGAVYVLCTPDTDYVSGQCLNVDAGSR